MDIQTLEELSEVRKFIPNFGNLKKKKKMHEFSVGDYYYYEYMDLVNILPGYHMTPTGIKLHQFKQTYSLKSID